MTHTVPTHIHDPDPPAAKRGQHGANILWTDEQVALLKEMLGQGLATGEIGAALGYSKSAICGKVRRLGLSKPRALLTEEEKEARLAKKRERDKHKKRDNRAKTKPERRPIFRIVRSSINTGSLRMICTITGDVGSLLEADIVPHNVSLLDLTDHDCRYPYGGEDEPIVFCGHPRQEKSSYCPAHHALVWVSPVARKVAA